MIVSEQETGRNYNLTSAHNELSVGNLHPFYWYNFKISAITIAEGPFSELYSLQTLEDGKCFNIVYRQLQIFNYMNTVTARSE